MTREEFYAGIAAYKEKLEHHGVPGQKWGVRNGPPYPIEDKVLKKGTRLNSVSDARKTTKEYMKSGRIVYTYNPNDKWDTKVYKGPFCRYLMMQGIRLVREHEFETTKDLIMPTKKERMDEFKAIMSDNKNKETYIRELNSMKARMEQYPNMATAYGINLKDLDLRNIKTEQEWKAAYGVFNHAMEASYMFKSTRDYIKNVSKKYDAMVDDNNVNIYNNAHDPIMIFNAKKVLKDVSDRKSPHFINVEEMLKNYDEVKTEMEKQGKKVVL